MYVLAWLIVIGMIVFALLIAAAVTIAVSLIAGGEQDEPTHHDLAPGHAGTPGSVSAKDPAGHQTAST